MTTAQSELDRLQQAKLALQDRVARTAVRSPVKGIVKLINYFTIGGVVQPGGPLMEIVTLDDTLLIEAKIPPSDIGFIHPNQEAKVKITAYDFSIYGGLPGIVEQISADSISEQENGRNVSHYQIRGRTKRNYLGSEKHPLPIIPGMLASVDILTGKKTVLDYLLKPILKAKERALRER